MLKALKNLAVAGREPSGALTGKQVTVGSRVVKVDRLLGEGGFATIYKCTDVDTGDVFALKHFLLTGNPEAARDVDTEVAVLERLQGHSVVRLEDAAIIGPPGAPVAAFVLMEFCPDSLVAFLQRHAFRLDAEAIIQVMLPICRAVAAMHALQPPLAHRDLKAENVLQRADGSWVLCDFGSASDRHGVLQDARAIAIEEEVVRKYTTPAYRAPELYDLYAREYIGPPVDIWALGVLLYLLCFGKLPFEGEAKLQVLNGRYTLPEGRPPVFCALIRDMLKVNPKERPSIQQVIAKLEACGPGGSKQAAAEPQPQVWPEAVGGAPARSSVTTRDGTAQLQGWADFGANAGLSKGAASVGSKKPAVHQRLRSSGSSGSWATFSPKSNPADAAPFEPVAPVSAGSFWSSFEDQAEMQGNKQHEEPSQQAAAHQDHAPLLQQQQPAAAAPQQLVQLPDASPLSTGLGRMTLGSHSQVASAGSESVTKPIDRPSHVVTSEPAGTGGATPSRSGSDLATDVGALQQHCAVLEQLLEARNVELQRLQKLVECQAEEIAKLRRDAAAAAAAATPAQQLASTSNSHPGSPAKAAQQDASRKSRLAQDISLLVPGSVPQAGSCSSSPGKGEDWVSFNSGTRAAGDAPTPTLLQPASSFKSTAGQSGLAASGALNHVSVSTTMQQAAAAAETLPRANVPSTLAKPGVQGSHAVQQLQSHPVQVTPESQAGPLRLPAGSAPIAVSRPAPARTGSAGRFNTAPSSGSHSPAVPGSPMAQHIAAAHKGHRRHPTAPNGAFFDDLNPLS